MSNSTLDEYGFHCHYFLNFDLKTKALCWSFQQFMKAQVFMKIKENISSYKGLLKVWLCCLPLDYTCIDIMYLLQSIHRL